MALQNVFEKSSIFFESNLHFYKNRADFYAS